MTPFTALVAVSDGDQLTAAEAGQLRVETMFLAGLLVLFFGVLLLYVVAQRIQRNADHRPPERRVEIHHHHHAPAELPPRWDWKGRPDALYHDVPAALPRAAPPPAPPAIPTPSRRALQAPRRSQ